MNETLLLSLVRSGEARLGLGDEFMLDGSVFRVMRLWWGEVQLGGNEAEYVRCRN